MDLPFGSDDPNAFADAPLFRELQRVMSSSSGPINWEMARQIGIANAQEGREDPAPTDVAKVKPVRRAEWVNANIQSLRELLEPAAQKIGEAMGAATREAIGP